VENCFNDGYQRNSIELIQNTGLGFLGQETVTYAFTIKDYPAPAYDSFQGHLFITENGASGDTTAPALDYNDTNLIWLNVQENADGTSTAFLRVKVNEQSSNSNLFGTNFFSINGASGLPSYAGTLASLNAATPVGTWGLTINNETNVTIFGPGVSTNITILAAEMDNFIDPLNIVLGAQPNNTNASYNGQSVVYANFGITNQGTSLFYDNFLADSTLNIANWRILAGEPNTVQLYPNDPAQVLVQWELPAIGYGLEIASSPKGPWTPLTGPDAAPPVPPITVNSTPGIGSVLVPGADLLNTNVSFFRLNGQSFIQLQILMPGETNAPGTVTGKTGSPFPESLSNPNGQFPVTINACDAYWSIISTVTDTITITSNDSTSSAPVGSPSAGTMVGGTTQIYFNFGQTGTFTVTATDTTTTTIPSVTSSPTQSVP